MSTKLLEQIAETLHATRKEHIKRGEDMSELFEMLKYHDRNIPVPAKNVAVDLLKHIAKTLDAMRMEQSERDEALTEVLELFREHVAAEDEIQESELEKIRGEKARLADMLRP